MEDSDDEWWQSVDFDEIDRQCDKVRPISVPSSVPGQVLVDRNVSMPATLSFEFTRHRECTRVMMRCDSALVLQHVCHCAKTLQQTLSSLQFSDCGRRVHLPPGPLQEITYRALETELRNVRAIRLPVSELKLTASANADHMCKGQSAAATDSPVPAFVSKPIKVCFIPPRTARVVFAAAAEAARWRAGSDTMLQIELVQRWQRLCMGCPRLHKSLYEHQRRGTLWALRRRGRVLVADEMGVGKTVQALAISVCYADEWPLLVVAPASMRRVWASAVERWVPSLQPHQIHLITSSTARLRRGPHAARARVVICSFHMAGILFDAGDWAMKQREWGVVIVDEAHELKTPGSGHNYTIMRSDAPPNTVSVSHWSSTVPSTTRAFSWTSARAATAAPAATRCLRQLLAHRAKRVLLLSGTPALQRPRDLWLQVHTLRPDVLGSLSDFERTYCGGHTQHGRDSCCSRADELHALLCETVMLRRLKADVFGRSRGSKVQAPSDCGTLLPKQRRVVMLDLDIDRRVAGHIHTCAHESVSDSQDENFRAVVSCTKAKVGPAQLCGLQKLETACNWIGRKLDEIFCKVDNGVEYCHEAMAQGETRKSKVVIFAHHVAVMDGIIRHIEMYFRTCTFTIDSGRETAQCNFVRFDGDLSDSERAHRLHIFNSQPHCLVCVVSIKAGGVGIDLSKASHAFFVELPSTVSDAMQAESRLHRPGQMNRVHVYYLVAQVPTSTHSRTGPAMEAAQFDAARWATLNRQMRQTGRVLDGRASECGDGAMDRSLDAVVILGEALTPPKESCPMAMVSSSPSSQSLQNRNLSPPTTDAMSPDAPGFRIDSCTGSDVIGVGGAPVPPDTDTETTSSTIRFLVSPHSGRVHLYRACKAKYGAAEMQCSIGVPKSYFHDEALLPLGNCSVADIRNQCASLTVRTSALPPCLIQNTAHGHALCKLVAQACAQWEWMSGRQRDEVGLKPVALPLTNTKLVHPLSYDAFMRGCVATSCQTGNVANDAIVAAFSAAARRASKLSVAEAAEAAGESGRVEAALSACILLGKSIRCGQDAMSIKPRKRHRLVELDDSYYESSSAPSPMASNNDGKEAEMCKSCDDSESIMSTSSSDDGDDACSDDRNDGVNHTSRRFVCSGSDSASDGDGGSGRDLGAYSSGAETQSDVDDTETATISARTRTTVKGCKERRRITSLRVVLQKRREELERTSPWHKEGASATDSGRHVDNMGKVCFVDVELVRPPSLAELQQQTAAESPEGGAKGRHGNCAACPSPPSRTRPPPLQQPMLMNEAMEASALCAWCGTRFDIEAISWPRSQADATTARAGRYAGKKTSPTSCLRLRRLDDMFCGPACTWRALCRTGKSRYIRRYVGERDGGRCELCRLDCRALVRALGRLRSQTARRRCLLRAAAAHPCGAAAVVEAVKLGVARQPAVTKSVVRVADRSTNRRSLLGLMQMLLADADTTSSSKMADAAVARLGWGGDLNTRSLRNVCRAQCVRAGHVYEIDHVQAVHQGGGMCGATNLRLLCRPCHKCVTAAQAAARAEARRQAKKEMLQCVQGAARKRLSDSSGTGTTNHVTSRNYKRQHVERVSHNHG